MNLNNKLIDRFFKSVDSCVWDLMTGKIGFKTSEGIVTIELNDISADGTEASNAQVSINPFDDFGMEIPAFAQSVPVNNINLGDMIFSSASNKVMGWVVKKNDKSFKLMKQDGTRSDWVPPKVNMLGFDSGVMVLRSLMNMLPGGSTGLSSMQSSLMPMMALGMLGEGNSEFDLKNIMPIMLMSQMGLGTTDASAANPMANMMPMMLMMKMLGNSSDKSFGGKSSNFFDKR